MCRVEEIFAGLGEVVLVDGRTLYAAQLKQGDILLVRSVTAVEAALLSGAQPCFVGSATSGTDHVDQQWLSERGIPFAHAPGCNANSVVEYVISAISHCDDTLERLMRGGTLGIVGYGIIGKRLASRARALGIACLAYDPWLPERGSGDLHPLELVLGCDVVTLHAELTDHLPWPSRHLLGPSELRALSPDALLINAARGPLIDNEVLLAYLESGQAANVVLDVWEHEPQLDPRLMACCRYATPHIAGYSYDGKVLATQMLHRAACVELAVPTQESATSIGDTGRVSVPLDLQGADLVRWLQLRSYDIRGDDERLRAGAGKNFDALRASYPRRRELGSVRIQNFKQLSTPSQQVIKAMGCICD